MTKKSIRSRRHALPLTLLSMGALAIVSSFTLGIKMAGDVTPFSPSEASDAHTTGDMNADGIVDVKDAIEILEIVQGYKESTPAQLVADPNGDGQLTIDDATRILHDLSIR